MHQAANSLSEIAAELGISLAALAVAWVAAPAITAPIISARNIEQLAPSLAAADITLDVDICPAERAGTNPAARDRQAGRAGIRRRAD